MFGWQYFVAMPQMKAEQARQAALAHQEKEAAASWRAPARRLCRAWRQRRRICARDAALKAGGARVAIDSPMLDGSIALKGAKLDDLRLKKYHETTDPKSPEIVLLAPKSTDYPYYAEFGWVGGADQRARRPDACGQQQGSGALSPGHPVTLSWDNGHGLIFTRIIAVDDQYMFNVTDSVANKSGAAADALSFRLCRARRRAQGADQLWVLHLGFVGVANGSETDANYDDFKDDGTPPKTFSSTGGWVGITDKYWMAAVIPPQNENLQRRLSGLDHRSATPRPIRPITGLRARTIAPGGDSAASPTACSPAPRWWTFCAAMKSRQGIARFDNAVDWGWFWFLTQPLFWLLDISTNSSAISASPS